MTRKTWGKVLIDEGIVRQVPPWFHQWAGRSGEALAEHYHKARFERL